MKKQSNVVPFVDVRAFIDALRFSANQSLPWQSGDPRRWVFRGLADARWQNIPSALRPQTWRPHSPDGAAIDRWIQGKSEPAWSHREQIRSEQALVRRFLVMSDVQGLRLPEGIPAQFEALVGGLAQPGDWPPPALRPLVGLAQHYGVPTRLLDWSRKPLIAAYFAASDCARQMEDGQQVDHLAVWAFDRWFTKSGRVRMIRSPRAGNPNLHLQSGLFTLFEPSASLDATLDADSFDLAAHCRSAVADGEPSVLLQLTLPANHAGELLRCLRDEFVQATTVYAGYDGAARSVLEHRWRQR